MLYAGGGEESVARVLTSTSGDDFARGEGLPGTRRLIMEGTRQQVVQNTSTVSTVSSADTGPFIVTRGPLLNALLSGNARPTGQSRAQAIAAAAQSHLAVYSNPAIRQILERRHQPSQPFRRPVVKKRARSEGPAREPSTEAPEARAQTQADMDAAELVGMEMEGDEMGAFAAGDAEGGGGGVGYGGMDATPKDEQGNGNEPHRPVMRRKRSRRPPTSTAPAAARTVARRRQQEEEHRKQAEAIERARKRMKAVPHSRPPRALSPDAQRARDETRARRAYEELERRSKEKQGPSKEDRDKRERLLALQEKIRKQTTALRAVKQSKSLRRLEREAEKLLRAQGINVAAGNESTGAAETVARVEPREEDVDRGEDEGGEEATEHQQDEEHKVEHRDSGVLSQPQEVEGDSQGYTPPGSDSPHSSEPADQLAPPQIQPPSPPTSPPPKPPPPRHRSPPQRTAPPASSPQRTARPPSSPQRAHPGPCAPPSRSPVKKGCSRPSTSPHKAKSPSQPRGGGRVVSVRPAHRRPSPTRPVAPSTVPPAAAADDDFSWLDDPPSTVAPTVGGGSAHGATAVAYVGLGGASTRHTAAKSGKGIRGDNATDSPTAGSRPRPVAGLHTRATQSPLVSGAAADSIADAHSTVANSTSSNRAPVRFASPEKRPLPRTSPIKQRTELVLREKLPAAQELLEGTNRADAKKRREEGRQYMLERKRKEAEQRRREEEEKREAQERIRKTLADIERVRANERTALVVHLPAATRQPPRPPWVGVLGPDAEEDALPPPSPPRPPITRKRVRDGWLALEDGSNGAAPESDAVPLDAVHRLERRNAAPMPPFEMSTALSSIAPAGETHRVEVEVEPAGNALQAHVETQVESTGMVSSGEVDFKPAEHDRAPHATAAHTASGHGGAAADLDATVPVPPPTVPRGTATAGKKTTTKRRSTNTTTTTTTTKRKKSSSSVKPRVVNRGTTPTRTRPVSARGGRASRPTRPSEPPSLDFADGRAMVLNLLEKLTHVQQRVDKLRAEVLGDTSASGVNGNAEQQPPRSVNDSITGQARRRPHTATEVWAETRDAIAAAMSGSQEGFPPSSAGYRSGGDDAEVPRSHTGFTPSATERSSDGGTDLFPSVTGRPSHDDTGSREEELLVDYDPLSPPPGQAGRVSQHVASESAAAGYVGEGRGWVSGFPHTDADEAFMIDDGGMAVSPRDADVDTGAGVPQLEHGDLDAEVSPLPAVELADTGRDEHDDMQLAGDNAIGGFISQESLRLPHLQASPAHQSADSTSFDRRGDGGGDVVEYHEGHGGGVADREEARYDDEDTPQRHVAPVPRLQSASPLSKHPARAQLDNLGNELKWTAVAQQRRMAEDVAEQFSQKRVEVAFDSRARSVKQQQQQQGKTEEEKGIPAVDIATALFGRRTPLPKAEDSEGAESESTDSMSVVHVFAKELLRQKVMQERKSEREKQKKQQQQQKASTAARAMEAPQQQYHGEVTPLPSPKSLQDAAGGGLIQDPAAVRAYWDRYLSRPAPGGRPDEVRKLERADSSSYSDEGFEDEDPGDRRHQHPSVESAQGRFEEGASLPSPIRPAPLHGDSHDEISMDERLAPVALHQALLNELQLQDGLWNAELQLEAMARQRATTEAEVSVQRAMNVMAAQQAEQQWGEALRRREEEHARQMADAVSLMRQQADHMAGMEMAQTIGLGQQLVDALQREAHAIESAQAAAAQHQRPPQPLFTSPHLHTLPPERQQQLRMQPATSADHASPSDHESQGYQTDVSYAQSFASPTSPATEVSTAPPSDVEEVEEEEEEEEDEQAYSEGFESVDDDVRSSRETSYINRRGGPGRISEIMDEDGSAEVGDEEHEVEEGVSESGVMDGMELTGFGVIERRMPSGGSTPASLPSASLPSRPSTSASLPRFSPKPPSVVGVESGLQGMYEGNKTDGYTAALIRGLREELEARSSRLLGSLTAKEKLAEEQRDRGLADLAKLLSTQGPEALLAIQAQMAEVGRVYCEAMAQVEADRKTVRAKREKELRRLAKMESEMRRYEDSLRAGMETSQTSTTSADDMVGAEPARPKRRARFARPQHGGLLRREVLGSKVRLPIPAFTRSASEASAGSSGVEEEGEEEEEAEYYTDDFDANASSRAASVMSDGEDAALPAAKETATASVGGSEQWTEGTEEEEPRAPSIQPSQATATPSSSYISSTAPEEEREEASAFEEGEFDEHEEEDEGEDTIRVGPPAPTSVMSRSARSHASEIPSDADRSMVSEASASAVNRSMASEVSGRALSAPPSSVGYSATFEEDEEGHVRVVQSGGVSATAEEEEFEDFEEEEGDEESGHPETPRGTSPVASHRSVAAASPGRAVEVGVRGDGMLARSSPSATDAHLGHASSSGHSVSRSTATPAEPPSPASSTASNALSLESLEELSRLRASEAELGARRVKLERLKEEAAMLLRFKREEQALAAEVRALARQALAVDAGGAGGGESVQEGGLRKEAEWRGWSADELDEVQSIIRASIAEYEQKRSARKAAQGPAGNTEVLPIPSSPMSQLGDLSFGSDGDLKGLKETQEPSKKVPDLRSWLGLDSSSGAGEDDDDEDDDEDERHEEHSTPGDSFASESGLDSLEQEEAIRRRFRLSVQGDVEPTREAMESAAVVIQRQVRRHQAACIMERSRRSPVRIREKRIHRPPLSSSSDSSLDVLSTDAARAARAQSQLERMLVTEEVGSEVSPLGTAAARQDMPLELGHDEPRAGLKHSERKDELAEEDGIKSHGLGQPHARGAEPIVGEYEEGEEEDGEPKGGPEQEEEEEGAGEDEYGDDFADDEDDGRVVHHDASGPAADRPSELPPRTTAQAEGADGEVEDVDEEISFEAPGHSGEDDGSDDWRGLRQREQPPPPPLPPPYNPPEREGHDALPPLGGVSSIGARLLSPADVGRGTVAAAPPIPPPAVEQSRASPWEQGEDEGSVERALPTVDTRPGTRDTPSDQVSSATPAAAREHQPSREVRAQLQKPPTPSPTPQTGAVSAPPMSPAHPLEASGGEEENEEEEVEEEFDIEVYQDDDEQKDEEALGTGGLSSITRLQPPAQVEAAVNHAEPTEQEQQQRDQHDDDDDADIVIIEGPTHEDSDEEARLDGRPTLAELAQPEVYAAAAVQGASAHEVDSPLQDDDIDHEAVRISPLGTPYTLPPEGPICQPDQGPAIEQSIPASHIAAAPQVAEHSIQAEQARKGDLVERVTQMILSDLLDEARSDVASVISTRLQRHDSNASTAPLPPPPPPQCLPPTPFEERAPPTPPQSPTSRTISPTSSEEQGSSPTPFVDNEQLLETVYEEPEVEDASAGPEAGSTEGVKGPGPAATVAAGSVAREDEEDMYTFDNAPTPSQPVAVSHSAQAPPPPPRSAEPGDTEPVDWTERTQEYIGELFECMDYDAVEFKTHERGIPRDILPLEVFLDMETRRQERMSPEDIAARRQDLEIETIHRKAMFDGVHDVFRRRAKRMEPPMPWTRRRPLRNLRGARRPSRQEMMDKVIRVMCRGEWGDAADDDEPAEWVDCETEEARLKAEIADAILQDLLLDTAAAVAWAIP